MRIRRKKKKTRNTGKYKSPLEQSIARRLGRKAKYETEVLQYLLPKRYKPDFILLKDGHKIYLEVKGYFRFGDQQKMRAVKACNPELDIRMYFPKDNRVQTSQMLNSEWCRKYNFPCYIGELPKDL